MDFIVQERVTKIEVQEVVVQEEIKKHVDIKIAEWDDRICIKINDYFVIDILPDGTFKRIGSISSGNIVGLTVDSEGKIKETK